MKYLPLVWATLWREKSRTVLTLLSIVVAFLLYGMLETANYAIAHPDSPTGADKLITTNRYSITLPLPVSIVPQIAALPGVATASWFVWFGGYYQEPKNFIMALPVDIDSYLDLHHDEFQIDPAQLATFKKTRSGVLVETDLAAKYGWKVGDRIPIHSTIWTNQDTGTLDWTFEVVGTYVPKEATLRSHMKSHMLFQYDYLDAGRSAAKGQISWVEERIKDPRQAAAISAQIDALFTNSSNETKTSPSADFAVAFFKQQGDIAFILRAIIGAVFFAMLFLTGNTMMQSVAERIPELGVMKTLGFSDRTVLTLVVVESLMLCLVAAAVGLGLAYLALPLLRAGLPDVQITASAMLPGFAFASVLALIVGLPPALHAMRLNIVDALTSIR